MEVLNNALYYSQFYFLVVFVMLKNFAQRRYRLFLLDRIDQPFNTTTYIGILIFSTFAVLDLLIIGYDASMSSLARIVFGIICFIIFKKYNSKRFYQRPLVEAILLIFAVFIITWVCLIAIHNYISHYQSGLLFIMLYIATLSRLPLKESLMVISVIILCSLLMIQPSLRYLNLPDVEQQVSNMVLMAIISISSCYRRELEFRSYYDQYLQVRRQKFQLKSHSKMLATLSVTDKLTQLHNRQYLDKVVELELANYENYGVLMLDIDHFKKINDVFGHLTGDRVIQDVSKFIKEFISPKSHVIRYGGEEFLIVVPNTNSSLLLDKAERLRKIIAKHCPVSSSLCADLKITISVGIAYAEDASLSLKEVIDRADKALYQSKRGGRDCSTLFI